MEAALKNNVIPYKQKHKPPKNYRELHGPVQPLRTKEDIQRAKDYFLNKPERYSGQNIRDYTIFILGINLGRRCGDLLQLRVSDILDEKFNIKNHIVLKEDKTGKVPKLVITPTVAEALQQYLNSLSEINRDNPLFISRQKDKYGNIKSMTTKNFYKKMQDLKEELELSEAIGTHTMRKTPGYHMLEDHPDDAGIVVKVSRFYGHDNIQTTFNYLGLTQKGLDDLMLDNQF